MALEFDGSDDYIEMSNPWAGEPNTFESWLKIPVDVPDGTRVGIVAGNYFQEHNINWEIHTSGRPRIYWNNGEVNWTLSSDLRTGNWLHYAFIRDKNAGKIYFYLNGELVDIHSGAGTDVTPVAYSRIGNDRRGAPGVPFHGLIGEVRIYNRALSPAEIQTIYHSRGSDNIVNGLVGRWLMNELPNGSTASGTGSVIDISGNGNHGTPNGGPVYRESQLKLVRPMVL